MKRLAAVFSLFLLLCACSDRNTPEGVAEDFVYNYYQRANQEAALLLSYSDSLAAEKLRDEIELLRAVRRPGDLPNEIPQIKYEIMGKKIQGENEVFFRYRLTIKSSSSSTSSQNVVVHTELIEGHWKIINFDEYAN